MRHQTGMDRARVIRLLALSLILVLLLARSGSILFAWSPIDTGGHDAIDDDIRYAEGLNLSDTAVLPLPESQNHLVAGSDGYDWPQVQRTAQRTGYTPEVLNSNFQVIWTHAFQPEKVYPQVQAIVYQGLVFVGTEMGNVYALNAQTGVQEWVYHVGAPILNSVAAGYGKVFFGAMDGAVYAIEAMSGVLAWKAQLSWRLGFSTAPLLDGEKVMLGGRDGIFYGMDPNSGEVLWQCDVGAPILQTAASDGICVYFGAMDMHVYALHLNDLSFAWQSPVIPGIAFKDYWPVVHDGKVLVRSMGVGGIEAGFPFGYYGASTNPEWNWIMTYGPTVAAGNLTSLPDAMQAQDAVLADYQVNSDQYTVNLAILDSDSGVEAFVVPHWTYQTMNGATTPPCVDRDGLLIVPVGFIRSGWGRLDLEARRIVDILYDHKDLNGSPMQPGSSPAGMGNFDENLGVSCTGNSVIAMHIQEGNANYTGVFDLDDRTWTQIHAGHTNRQLSTNTQGGGANPASVAYGIVYHISWHELIARSTN